MPQAVKPDLTPYSTTVDLTSTRDLLETKISESKNDLEAKLLEVKNELINYESSQTLSVNNYNSIKDVYCEYRTWNNFENTLQKILNSLKSNSYQIAKYIDTSLKRSKARSDKCFYWKPFTFVTMKRTEVFSPEQNSIDCWLDIYLQVITYRIYYIGFPEGGLDSNKRGANYLYYNCGFYSVIWNIEDCTCCDLL